MADQKVVDKFAKSIATTYEKGITDIVEKLMEGKGKVTDEEFVSGLLSIDMKEVVETKLKDIQTNFAKAHLEVLKTVSPFGKVKKNE